MDFGEEAFVTTLIARLYHIAHGDLTELLLIHNFLFLLARPLGCANESIVGSQPSFTLLQGFYKAELVVTCSDEPSLVNFRGLDRAP